MLPPLMLVLPEFAWEHSCMDAINIPTGAEMLGGVAENPCELIEETPQPLWMGLLVVSMLMVACSISGALAARIAEERRFVVAFFAPFLGYLLLNLSGGPSELLSPFALTAALAAGLFGSVGAGWQHLTNAWRATRSKQRAPQA